MVERHQTDRAALQACCEAIRGAKQAALIGHVTPDADCLGAMGALGLALPELGVAPHAALPDGSVSRRLRWLVQHGAMRPASAAALSGCDVAIVLDTAKDRRVNLEGKLESLPGATVINVDHHATNTRFGAVNWIEPWRSSTCEMTLHLIRALGCQVTPTIATLLYAGIHADTAGFALSNTTPESLQAGHELSAAGARIAELCEQLLRNHSRSEFALLKLIYGNTHVSADGRLAWSSASHSEILATGSSASDVDDQVNIPRSIADIDLALLFTEGEPGKVRMNFRGERGLSVLELAQQFGGGGHRASAGAMLDGDLKDIMERVLAAAQRFLAG